MQSYPLLLSERDKDLITDETYKNFTCYIKAYWKPLQLSFPHIFPVIEIKRTDKICFVYVTASPSQNNLQNYLAYVSLHHVNLDSSQDTWQFLAHVIPNTTMSQDVATCGNALRLSTKEMHRLCQPKTMFIINVKIIVKSM